MTHGIHKFYEDKRAKTKKTLVMRFANEKNKYSHKIIYIEDKCELITNKIETSTAQQDNLNRP